MAPDVNTLPPSPRSNRPASLNLSASQPSSVAVSRRASQQMPPPSAPASATSPSSHAPARRSSVAMASDQTGPPLRHPRPLTAAELWSECEKEQEAVVNRLTRELTALRAQTASVASNASHSSNSTSASLLPVDISDPNPTHQITGATHPTPSRRHRSSSSLSARSVPNTPSTTASASGSSTTNLSTQVQAGSAMSVPIGGVSQASADRAAAAVGNSHRQPSANASGTSTPARQSLDVARQTLPSINYAVSQRPSLSRDHSFVSQNTAASSTAAHAGTPVPPALPSPARSPSQSVTSQHYVDTATYRTEMEIVKAENEALRQRVRALERALTARRRDSSTSDVARPDGSGSVTGARMTMRDRDSLAIATSPTIASPEGRLAALSPAGLAAWAANDSGVGGVAGPRERSESQSTTASSRRGLPAEDEVRFGESAGSVGVGRGL